MSVPRSGRKRCPFSGDGDNGDAQRRVPHAARARPHRAGAATRRRRPPAHAVAAHAFLTASPARPDVTLEISGFMRPLHLTLDHDTDCVRVTALPRNATLEFPLLPDGSSDAREIDFGRAHRRLAQRRAPLASLVAAMVCASDGGMTVLINELDSAHALRVVIAPGAAPLARAQLCALVKQAQRGQQRLHSHLRLVGSGLAPIYWISFFAPLAGRLWRALPALPRQRVCAYFRALCVDSGLHPAIDLGAALSAASPRRLAILLEVLAGALDYWLTCARLDRIPIPYWDRHIVSQGVSRASAADFIATAHRLLQQYRAPATDPRYAPCASLAASLADPAVRDIELGAGAGKTVCIPPLARDITFKVVDVDSCVEFTEFGCGWANLQTGAHTRSLAIRLRHAGYRLPRYLLSNLRRDPDAGVRATLTDMREGGGLTLVAPAAVVFDAPYWNQLKTDADFRLEMSMARLLEWSEVLSQGRRLSAEQDRCLVEHVQELPAGPGHWTTELANALIEQMHGAAAARAPGPRQSIQLLQQLQVAQLQLYLSGGLLRALSADRWRRALSRHGRLASIVARITAVHVDCAWDAMDAQHHYRALCSHLHAIERSERDPIRRDVLLRERELLDAVVSVMAGDSDCPLPAHARDLAAGAHDEQHRLVLKMILLGALDARLFASSDQWRSILLRRLRQESMRPARALDMNDMALIAFLRHADAAQLRMRLAT